MLKSTTEILRCPRSQGKHRCLGHFKIEGDSTRDEVVYGFLICQKCKNRFPIYEGVALVIPKVNEYILSHVKGISKFVADTHIPKDIIKTYRKIRDEQIEEHIEEDLESDRVTALYLMNHYLRASDIQTVDSPCIQKWISEYWDRGPMEWVSARIPQNATVLELGCGVGGLAHRAKAQSYLGVDGSFQSILLARHLNLGVPYRGILKIPGDLIKGPLEERFPIKAERDLYSSSPACDFLVGELDAVPVVDHAFSVSVAMNAIDMLDDPRVLPKAQKQMVQKDGRVIQCAPYIWAPQVSKRLRKALPQTIRDSSEAVEWMYAQEGMEILQSERSIPWLFYKHARQIELYDVHGFIAKT